MTYYETHKDQFKAYNKLNKDRLSQYWHDYYVKNMDKVKAFRAAHKDQISTYFKTRRVYCPTCHVNILIGSKTNHYRSKRHLARNSSSVPPS